MEQQAQAQLEGSLSERDKLIQENEKLKKALDKSKERLFYIAKKEKHCDQNDEKCYCERNSAQIALKEIESILKGSN